MHNHDDKYPTRSGFEPGTSRLQAPVHTNEQLGPAHSDGNNHSLFNVGTALWINMNPALGHHS